VSLGIPREVIEMRLRLKKRLDAIKPGVHLEWNPREGERQRVVVVAQAVTTDEWQVRVVAADGALGPLAMLSSADVEWECSVLGTIPTHEPTTTRGRTRLKPGHAL
jgi:hypothetical protein